MTEMVTKEQERLELLEELAEQHRRELEAEVARVVDGDRDTLRARLVELEAEQALPVPRRRRGDIDRLVGAVRTRLREIRNEERRAEVEAFNASPEFAKGMNTYLTARAKEIEALMALEAAYHAAGVVTTLGNGAIPLPAGGGVECEKLRATVQSLARYGFTADVAKWPAAVRERCGL